MYVPETLRKLTPDKFKEPQDRYGITEIDARHGVMSWTSLREPFDISVQKYVVLAKLYFSGQRTRFIDLKTHWSAVNQLEKLGMVRVTDNKYVSMLSPGMEAYAVNYWFYFSKHQRPVKSIDKSDPAAKSQIKNTLAKWAEELMKDREK